MNSAASVETNQRVVDANVIIARIATAANIPGVSAAGFICLPYRSIKIICNEKKIEATVVKVSPIVQTCIASGANRNPDPSHKINPVKIATPNVAIATPAINLREGRRPWPMVTSNGVKTTERLVRKPLLDAGIVASPIVCRINPQRNSVPIQAPAHHSNQRVCLISNR